MTHPASIRWYLPIPAVLAALVLTAPAGCGGDGAGADASLRDTLSPADVPADPGTDPGTEADILEPQDVPFDEGSSDVWSFDVTIPEMLGGERPALLVVPVGYRPDRTWPLVILLHGYSASAYILDCLLGMSERSDSHGLVVLLPDGTVNSEQFLFWNAWPPCCDFEGSNVDDVGYLRGLIDEAKATLSIDPERVFLVGHSNGGFMSTRMACEASDLVAGIVSIAGSMSPELNVPCTPARPLSLLAIHGTNDNVIGYEGGSIGKRAYIDSDTLVERWLGFNDCTPTVETGEPLDFDLSVTGAETNPTSWPECAEGTRVDRWKMMGSSHVPGFSTALQDSLADWLVAARRAPATRHRACRARWK